MLQTSKHFDGWLEEAEMILSWIKIALSNKCIEGAHENPYPRNRGCLIIFKKVWEEGKFPDYCDWHPTEEAARVAFESHVRLAGLRLEPEDYREVNPLPEGALAAFEVGPIKDVNSTILLQRVGPDFDPVKIAEYLGYYSELPHVREFLVAQS